VAPDRPIGPTTFHLVAQDTWEAADPGAPYVAGSLAVEGFVHCTDGVDEMVATADRHYGDRMQLAFAFAELLNQEALALQADGVEVLFYCLRMGRCMLAAMAAGYQRMLARDTSHYAMRRLGVGGPVIRHEVPRLNLGRILGGALQSRALAYLSLQQDADAVDLAGLRDLTKSAAAGTGAESMVAAEHVLGGRSFHGGSRVNDARVNLHLFGVVEGEDDERADRVRSPKRCSHPSVRDSSRQRSSSVWFRTQPSARGVDDPPSVLTIFQTETHDALTRRAGSFITATVPEIIFRPECR